MSVGGEIGCVESQFRLSWSYLKLNQEIVILEGVQIMRKDFGNVLEYICWESVRWIQTVIVEDCSLLTIFNIDGMGLSYVNVEEWRRSDCEII